VSARKRRIVAAAAALAAYAACGTSDHPIEEAADPTLGLEQAIPTTPTTTTVPPRVVVAKPSRSRPVPAPAPPWGGAGAARAGTGDIRNVTSTAYCLTGIMANGQHTYRGAVAMNGVPLGSVWEVDGGGIYTVADRIGHGSSFDIAMPGDCEGARAYGRRTITIRRVR
jgi:3D (Asp-Asp-Asp) domain-containing protein